MDLSIAFDVFAITEYDIVSKQPKGERILAAHFQSHNTDNCFRFTRKDDKDEKRKNGRHGNRTEFHNSDVLLAGVWRLVGFLLKCKWKKNTHRLAQTTLVDGRRRRVCFGVARRPSPEKDDCSFFFPSRSQRLFQYLNV